MKVDFRFESGTCKERWSFDLAETPGGHLIRDLTIDERSTPKGCSGHPGTIRALVIGRTLESIDTGRLADAACGMSQSCGQSLAKCIRQLIDNLK